MLQVLHCTPDPNFIYHYRYNYQKTINRGRAVYYGTNVYSSTYDAGEWWCSGDFYPNIPLKLNTGNLYSANTSFTPKLNVAVAGTFNSKRSEQNNKCYG